MKVIVTGASGVLGRAVVKVFAAEDDVEVKGLAFSRSTPALTKLDLLNSAAVRAYLEGERPDVVVHCAAERRPDAAAADPEGARRLNAVVPELLAKLAAENNFRLVYISTDYVFDGTKPPYLPQDKTNPLQLYGETKAAGEKAVLDNANGKGLVLRVPILYGETEYNSETAVNVLLDIVQDRTGKQYKMDAYQSRLPTNVEDVARCLLQIARRFPPSQTDAPEILHFSSHTRFNKYEMCQVIARALGDAPIDHIVEDRNKPTDGVVRPEDTTLSTDCLAEAGIAWEERVPFAQWWTEHLARPRA